MTNELRFEIFKNWVKDYKSDIILEDCKLEEDTIFYSDTHTFYKIYSEDEIDDICSELADSDISYLESMIDKYISPEIRCYLLVDTDKIFNEYDGLGDNKIIELSGRKYVDTYIYERKPYIIVIEG